jgi:glutamate/tyrosine decarboxylase-like PLP-dependent enzyme
MNGEVKMTSPFREVLEQTLTHTLKYLEHLEDTPVAATTPLEELRHRFGRQLPDAGMEATQVIDELVTDAAGGVLGSASGRFFGWVIGGSLPAALAADWLTATWDQNAARYSGGPAVAVIEEVCGTWLKELLELPAGASFALVSGSQMAHVTCLAATGEEGGSRSG